MRTSLSLLCAAILTVAGFATIGTSAQAATFVPQIGTSSAPLVQKAHGYHRNWRRGHRHTRRWRGLRRHAHRHCHVRRYGRRVCHWHAHRRGRHH